MIKIPYRPLEFSQSDVAVYEELIFSKRFFPLSKKDFSQRLRFVLPAVNSNESFDFHLPLEIDHHHIDLALKPTIESNITKSLSQFGGKESIPKDFLDAVIAFCSQKILQLVESFFQLPVSLRKAEEKEDGDDAVEGEQNLCFEVLNKDSLVEIYGAIKLPSVLLEKLLAMASTLPRAIRSDLNQFPFQGEIVIGTTQVSPLQFNKLTLGDLVFFEEPSALVTGEVFFHFGNNQRLPISLGEKKLNSLIRPLEKIVISPLIPKETPELEKKENVQEDELASLEKRVNRELSFSAGRLFLTKDEITHGAKLLKIPDTTTVSNPLKIYAHGACIGAGELVELHGQHAVFITQLNLIK
jgi:hypothetical protein